MLADKSHYLHAGNIEQGSLLYHAHSYRLGFIGTLYFLGLLIFSIPNSYANTFNLSADSLHADLAAHIQYLENPDSALSFQKIRDLNPSAWQLNQQDIFNQGYSPSQWWIKLKIHNNSENKIERFIEMGYPVIDYLSVYIQSEDKLTEYKLGDKQPFHERIIDHRNFIVPLSFKKDETLTVYLSIKSSSSIQAPLALWEERSFFSQDRIHTLFYGFYFGIMLVMVLYNLFVYLGIGDRNYLYYVMTVTCMPLFIASLSGFSFQYLWPTSTHWNDQSVIIMLSGTILFGILFTDRLLKGREFKGIVGYFPYIVFIISVVIMLLSFFYPYSTVIRILISFACIACTYALILGIYRWRQGNSSARYYTIAWSFLLTGGIVLAANKLNIIPRNTFTDYAAQIGSALEVVLLSFALAEKINQERTMRYQAQSETLQSERNLRTSQENALDMQKMSNKELADKNKQIQEILEATSEMAHSTFKQSASMVALDYLNRLDKNIDLHSAYLYLPQKIGDDLTAYQLYKDGEFVDHYMPENVSPEKGKAIQAINCVHIENELLTLPIQSKNRTHAYLEISRYKSNNSDLEVSKSIMEGIAKSLMLKLDNLDAEEDQRLSSIGAMAASIVHDLKNPIGAIIGYTDLAKEQNISETTREDYLNIIRQEAMRLSSIAHEVLEFSRGEIKLEIKQMNSAPFMEDIKRIIQSLFESESMDCNINIDYEGCIELDDDRIRRVILNLATNALDAMQAHKTKSPAFSLNLHREKNNLVITIKDNGPGIPEQIKATLFEPFVTHGKSNGTGLGMAIVKKMIIAHNGAIDFKSSEKSGTTFRIVLPQSESVFKTKIEKAKHKTTLTNNAQNSPSTLADSDANPSKKTILVVDDNPVNRKLIESYLKKLGYLSQTADSAQAAFNAIVENKESQPFDLILMDIEMPEMNGIEATLMIHAKQNDQQTTNTPIVALTGHSDQDLIQECINAGMSECLSKPIVIADLSSCLQRYL